MAASPYIAPCRHDDQRLLVHIIKSEGLQVISKLLAVLGKLPGKTDEPMLLTFQERLVPQRPSPAAGAWRAFKCLVNTLHTSPPIICD